MEEFNNLNSSVFNEKSLYRLSIKELRVLGRALCVPSPTTKKKQELIDYILKIIYGKIEVPIVNTFGRKPNEKNIDIEALLNKIKNNFSYDTEFINYNYSEDLGALKVSSPSSEYFSEDNYDTRTYCNVDGKHMLRARAFMESPDDIELTSEFVEKFKLVHFDTVEIIVSGSLIKIISINGIKNENCLNNITVDNNTVYSGESRDFYLSTKEKIDFEIEKLIENYCSKGVSVILFTKNEYKNKNLQSIKYSEDETNSQIYKKLMLFAGLCEKTSLEGEDIIMIIDDGDFVKNTLSEFDPDVSKRMMKYFNDMFKSILKLGNIYISFNIEDEVIY